MKIVEILIVVALIYLAFIVITAIKFLLAFIKQIRDEDKTHEMIYNDDYHIDIFQPPFRDE